MTTDEHAIADILKRLEIAWNAGDSGAFATPFADNADFIHIFGGQLEGRPAVEASHRVIFDTIYKGSRASFMLRNIRFLRPDVAIVFARAHLEFHEGVEKRHLDTRPTLVMVREKTKWQILVFQNTKVSEMPAAAEAASRLAI